MTQEPDEGAQRFFDWLDAKEAAVRPTVSEPLRAAGYVVYHTGGGCLTWYREINEVEYLWISWYDALDGDPEAAEWSVGRYHDDGGWINLNQLFTLREAIEVAAKLPAPRRVDGSMIEMVFDTLDDAQLAATLPLVHNASLDLETGQLAVSAYRGAGGELVVTIATHGLSPTGRGSTESPKVCVFLDETHVWGPRAGVDAVWPVHLGLDSFPDVASIERGMLSNLTDEWHATAVDADGHLCDTRLKVSVERRTGDAARAVDPEPCPRCGRRLLVDGECLVCSAG